MYPNILKQGCQCMFENYDVKIENHMRSLFLSLSEKDRRRYAAIEAIKLGHGGIVYIAVTLGCDEKTISKGIAELGVTECMEQNFIRHEGGGRISILDQENNIDQVFLEVLKEHTAGDPMDEKVKWSNLTRSEISKGMAKKGIKISKNIVKKLLKKHGYVKRKALKKKATGKNINRDQQFKKISRLRKEYENSANPIVSIDAKKKNLLGNYIEKADLSAQKQ
jgi:hypothetical protein